MSLLHVVQRPTTSPVEYDDESMVACSLCQMCSLRRRLVAFGEGENANGLAADVRGEAKLDGLDGVELVCAAGVLGDGGPEGAGDSGACCRAGVLAAGVADDAVGTVAGTIFGAILDAKKQTANRGGKRMYR